MAAPSNTIWSSVVNGYYRLGFYISTSSTDTVTSASIDVWLWTKYSTTDSGNTLYFNDNATSATTGKGSVSISTTVSTGSGWSTSNQVKIYSYTTPSGYNRSSVNQTVHCAAKIGPLGSDNATVSFSTSYTIPKLASYTISYNANGGSGAPSSQTKYYGVALTLSSTKPTRTGYTFKGWGTSASATTASYQAGGTYPASSNANATLYAVWQANTYIVSYNANGGSGAPASQTKTHGTALTLSTTKPTRTNYTFLGWGTSASATTATYTAGASYTTNANATLYAVWEQSYSEPTVTSFNAYRSTSAGAADDFGTYAMVAFSWSCDQMLGTNAIKSIEVSYKLTTAASWTSSSVSASGTSGSVSQIIGGGALSVDNAYDVKITVTDSKNGATTMTRTIGSASFPIDFLAGGKGVAIGKPATKENALDIEWSIYDKFGTEIRNGFSAYNTAAEGVIDPDTTSEELVLTNHANGPISGTFFYIRTVWYGGKSASSYRAQHAVPYNSAKAMYHRYYNGSWSSWIRSATDSDIYTHPTTSGNKHIPSGGSQGQFLGWYADGTATWRNPITPLWTGSNNCTTALTIANSYSNQYQALLFVVQVAYTSSLNHLVTTVVPKSVLATTDKVFVFESSGVATHLAIKYSGTSIIVSQNAYLSRGGSLVGVYGLS